MDDVLGSGMKQHTRNTVAAAAAAAAAATAAVLAVLQLAVAVVGGVLGADAAIVIISQVQTQRLPQLLPILTALVVCTTQSR